MNLEQYKPESKKDARFVIAMFLVLITLLFVPTGFEKYLRKNSLREKGKVIEVDNSLVRRHNIIITGSQKLKVEVLSGEFKGEVVKTVNYFTGKKEFDKMFAVDDTILVTLDLKDGKIIHGTAIDRYRINLILVLFVIFFIMLVGFAGWTGFKAVLSFAITILVIWKLLLPAYLRGWSPIPISIIFVILITSAIIFLIGGINRKGVVAFLGSISGMLITCVLSLLFGTLFKIHGAVKPFSEALLYTGFPFLKLHDIFLSGIFVASSGAVMDIAMDISTAMHEIVQKKPDIQMKELVKSGLEIGKAVIGTMATTLLLAYSAGFSTMFMVFIAMGTPILNILNMQYVSAEILHTLVGSFGLICVAPFTAFIGGALFLKKEKEIKSIS